MTRASFPNWSKISTYVGGFLSNPAPKKHGVGNIPCFIQIMMLTPTLTLMARIVEDTSSANLGAWNAISCFEFLRRGERGVALLRHFLLQCTSVYGEVPWLSVGQARVAQFTNGVSAEFLR